ncbi:MAG: hypothetical protein IAF94_22820 [Pirellulaceae bacterium]|nr:hypothetical protein [Pirellulaceae bacterium]
MRSTSLAAALACHFLACIFATQVVAQVAKEEPPQDGPMSVFHPKFGYLVSERNYRAGKLHGLSRKFDKFGNVLREETFDTGELHGIRRYYEAGVPASETIYVLGLAEGPYWAKYKDFEAKGQYLQGKREGKWTEIRAGKWELVRNFKAGVLDGLWERKNAESKEVLRLTFKQGELVGGTGELSQYAFLTRALAMKGDKLPPDPAVNYALKVLVRDVDLSYPETPIREVIGDLRERLSMPMYVDEQTLAAARISSKTPVTIDENSLPLFVGLHNMTKRRGLTFDYRYHALWLTTPQGVREWQDPTGIQSLKPAKGSPLEKALGEPAGFDFLATDFSDLAAVLKKQHGLTVNASALGFEAREGRPEKLRAGPFEKSLPLRDALGILLTLRDCRCHEKDGVLVIEPRERLQ